ncbi:MAG: DNA-binding protein, partial [Sporomusa sp.]|nr:DNA-binding protein [Sporomusa sp.]
MPVTIAVNSIIDWMEGSNIINQERVLWINHEQSFAVVLDLLDSKSRPKRRNLQDIYMAIQEKQAIKHPCDPYLKSFIDFRKKHMEKAEKVWNFIGEIVECEPDIYDSKRKFTMVKDCAEKNQISQSAIYKYIRMYWQGGKTKLALLPEFSNCGAPNKPKPDTTIKRGRPTKHKIGVGEQNTAEVADSINVTEEMKGIFQAAITLYYYRDKNATPAQVFN